MKLHLESNIAEGTPEELVEYLRLVEGNSSDNQLFSFGHSHQPDEDTLKSLVGSLVKMPDSYTGSTKLSVDEAVDEAIEEEEAEPSTGLQVGDKVKVLASLHGAEGEATVTKVLEGGNVLIAGTSKVGTYLPNWSNHVSLLEKIEEEVEPEEDDDEADIGEFYTVNVDNSALPKGTILKKVDKHTLKDSLGDEYLHVDANAVEHIDKQLYDLEDRFSFATQVGVRLSDITDLARATEGDYFKVTDSYEYLNEGDIVTIDEDDRDNQPQCKDKHGNFYYVYLGHLELIQDSTETSTDEAETSSTGLQVGDRVKVLDSACGAVGEATVTAVHENGEVEIAGTSREGIYLSNWSSHVTLLEKIEEVEDKLMGYTFWYLDTANFNTFVVLKASLEGYFEDSTGKRYTYQAVSGYAKPIDNEYARKAFERARHNGKLLKYYPTVDAFQTSY